MRQPLTTRRVHLWLALTLGIGLTLSALGGLTLAQAAGPLDSSPSGNYGPPPEFEKRILPTYARVITGGVPVYQDPTHATQGREPLRWLDAGYVWVTLAAAQPITHSEQLWYAVNPAEYIQADYLEIYQPSDFRGVPLLRPSTFAWLIFDAYTAPAPGALPDSDSVLLARYTIVPIEEEATVDERKWYRVGRDRWLEQGMLGLVSPKPRPKGIGPDDKWIEVDLYEQTLIAYEGDRMVYATLVSSGLPWWQTEQGLFQIWLKVKQGKMSGREGYPDYYFLEDVPWTMYFNRDFALHGAYWHDRFGIQHSHGCVNLSLTDSKWLFEWAAPHGQTDYTVANEDDSSLSQNFGDDKIGRVGQTNIDTLAKGE